MIKWWNARDKICGFLVTQNVTRGLEEARSCVPEVDEAVWFTSFFPPGNTPPMDANAMAGIFERSSDRSDHYWAFHGILMWREREVRRAAEAGHAFAQVWMLQYGLYYERERWCMLAAKKGERYALTVMAGYTASIELYKRAADKECPMGMWDYARKLDNKETRYRYYCRSANISYITNECIHKKMAKIINTCNWPIVWIVGTTFVTDVYDSEYWVRIIDLCKRWTEYARAGLHAWSLCAKRLGLYVDLRRYIGQYVWLGRTEGWTKTQEIEPTSITKKRKTIEKNA